MKMFARPTTIAFLIFIFISSAFSQAGKAKQAGESKPFVIGSIEEIHSTILAEKRILNIYLPDGYNKNDTTKYNVIYLLDGSADEDFIHVVGLVQFSTFPWVNRIPKSIVVGIGNTDRKRDFTFPSTINSEKSEYKTAGKSENFIGFLEKELQPFIESKYKSSGTKTIIGESLGGLLATEILLKKPRLFDKYIIVSPSIWWDNGSLLNLSSDIFMETFNKPIDIYLAAGKEGLAPSETPHVMEVDVNVLVDKIRNSKSKTVRVHFDYLPEEDHATIGEQAVLNAFKVLYNTKTGK